MGGAAPLLHREELGRNRCLIDNVFSKDGFETTNQKITVREHGWRLKKQFVECVKCVLLGKWKRYWRLDETKNVNVDAVAVYLSLQRTG